MLNADGGNGGNGDAGADGDEDHHDLRLSGVNVCHRNLWDDDYDGDDVNDDDDVIMMTIPQVQRTCT